jgi:photosystem II stability/assembly factor-like uncharacterized protein
MKTSLLLLMLYSLSPVIAQQNWIELYNSNTGSTVPKAFFVNQHNIWGTGGGYIFYSEDSGSSWMTQFANSDYNFSDVYFTDSLNGWVVGWSEVLHTNDGGANWEMQQLPNPLGLDVSAVFFINPDTGWIAGSYRTIYVTYDGGENWILQQPHQFSGSLWLYDICFCDSQRGCAVGGRLGMTEQGVIYNTIDGGLTWIQHLPEASKEFSTVHYLSQDTIWAGDQSGRFYRSVDGGLNWDFYMIFWGQVSYSIEDFHFFDDNHSIALLGPYRIAETFNQWIDYEIRELGIYFWFSDLAFNSMNQGIIIGNGNTWLTLDEGLSWESINKKFYRLDFSSASNGWMSCLSPDKSLMKTTDGGISWTLTEGLHTAPVTDIDFITDQLGYYSSENGEFYRTTDGGLSWESISLPPGISLIRKILFVSPDTGMLIGDNNKLLRTVDGSQSWIVQDFALVNYLTDLYFLNGQWGSITGSDGYTAITSNGCETWEITLVADTYPYKIWFKDQDFGFFLTSGGTLYRTSNGGHTWYLSNLTAHMAVAIGFSDFEEGWVAGWRSVYKTVDGGMSWQQEVLGSDLESQEFITDFKIVDSQTAFFCTSNGKLYAYDKTTQIEETLFSNTLICYPNPAENQTTLSYKGEFTGKENLLLFDLSGVRVLDIDYHFQAAKFVINTSLLKNGLYILSVENQPELSIKIIKN